MSTSTDTLPGAIPAGVMHTISRAFRLGEKTKVKLEEGARTDVHKAKS